MGRKTHLSIGRPLPGRISVVLSRTSEFDPQNSFWQVGETALFWAENRESALFFADVMSVSRGMADFFVIGGAEMYRLFGDLFNKIYITDVMTGDSLRREPEDAVFDYEIDYRKWRTIESKEIPAGPNDDYASRYSVLERKTKTVRYVEVRDYFSEVQSKKAWLQTQLELFDEIKTTSSRKPIKIDYQYELFEDPRLFE
jgi:dihydrofolate reductase